MQINRYAMLAIILILPACATMDENECVSADWHIIGIKDGSEGRQISYLDNHRKACAEHKVTPNIEQYEMGRAKGLSTYCTPQKGYQLGSAGRSFPTVCPENLTDAFQSAYNSGKSIYKAKQSVKTVEQNITSIQDKIERIKQNNLSIEASLIHGYGSVADRKDAIKKLNNQKEEITRLVLKLERQRERLDLRKERLKSLISSVPMSYN